MLVTTGMLARRLPYGSILAVLKLLVFTGDINTFVTLITYSTVAQS